MWVFFSALGAVLTILSIMAELEGVYIVLAAVGTLVALGFALMHARRRS